MNTITKGEVMANMKEVVCRTEEVLGKPVTHVSVRMKTDLLCMRLQPVSIRRITMRESADVSAFSVLRKRFGSCWDTLFKTD